MESNKLLIVALSPGFPDACVAMIEEVSPRVRLVRLQDDDVPHDARNAEILAAWDFKRERLARWTGAMPRLRWVQTPVAGIGDRRLHEVLPPGTALLSAAGVYGDMVAEHALMLMLALYKRLPELIEQQRREQWDDLETGTLAGQTLGIIGAGGIGRAAARLARAFGMRTIGIHRGSEPIEDVDVTLPQEDRADLLRQSDVVLLATPLTAQTRGMVDASFLRMMQARSLLINVARGKVVVTDDLVAALRDGRIAGAGLDVTDPEPLPAGHPLWHLPGVIVTPHHANPTLLSQENAVRRFRENLRRDLAGETLIAVVDPERGY